MSVNDILTNILNDLQAYNATVIGRAECAPTLDKYPMSVDTMNIPFALSWPVESTWHQEGQSGALKRIDQGVEIIVYTMPIAQNDIPSRAAADVVLLQKFRLAYLDGANVPVAYPTASEPYQLTIESSSSSPHSDSGLRADLQMGGRPFAGFSLRIRVRAKW